jgi:hypothetical protein
VAIAAIDAVVAHMMLVTELDWLLSFDPLPRVPRGAINLSAHPESSQQDKNGAENT